jgi:hypothetical protein
MDCEEEASAYGGHDGRVSGVVLLARKTTNDDETHRIAVSIFFLQHCDMQSFECLTRLHEAQAVVVVTFESCQNSRD